MVDAATHNIMTHRTMTPSYVKHKTECWLWHCWVSHWL